MNKCKDCLRIDYLITNKSDGLISEAVCMKKSLRRHPLNAMYKPKREYLVMTDKSMIERI